MRCRCRSSRRRGRSRRTIIAARRRAGRPRRRAQRHAADPARRARSSASSKGFGGDLAEGGDRDLRRRRGRRPTAAARRARASPGSSTRLEQPLPMVQSRRPLELRAGEVARRVADGRVDLGRRRPATHRGPGRVGHVPPGGARSTAPGATDERHASRSAGTATQTAESARPPRRRRSTRRATRAARPRALKIAPRFAGKATLAVVGDKVHDIRGRRRAGRRHDGDACRSRRRMGRRRLCVAHRSTGRSTQAAKRMPAARSASPGSRSTRRARTLDVAVDAPAKMRPRGPLTIPSRSRVSSPARRLCHGRGRRCRHPQPHPLQAAGAGRLVFRPAPARHGDPRPLRLAHRRHAGRAGAHPLGRRRRRGAPAGAARRPEAARLLLRHRQGRRRTASATVTFDMPDFNGTVRVMAMAWIEGRGRPAPAKDVIVRDPVVRHRQPAALPHARRPVALPRRDQQCRGRRPATTPSIVDGRRARHGRRRTHARSVSLEAGAQAPASTSRSRRPARRLADLDVSSPGPDGARSTAELRSRAARRRRSPYARHSSPLDGGGKLTVGERPSGRVRARDDARRGLGRRRRPARRAGAARGARPLPLWLRRADRPAARMPLLYLNEVAERDRHGQRHRAARAHPEAIDRRASRPGLRPAASACGVRRLRRPVARRLCHRLPDPGRASRATTVPQAWRATIALEQSAATAVGYDQDVQNGRRGHRLCALRAGPQRAAGDRRSALLRRDQARSLHDPAGRGPARRRARALRRHAALGSAFKAALAELGELRSDDYGIWRADYGSRAARRRGDAGARRRDRSRCRRSCRS